MGDIVSKRLNVNIGLVKFSLVTLHKCTLASKSMLEFLHIHARHTIDTIDMFSTVQ